MLAYCSSKILDVHGYKYNLLSSSFFLNMHCENVFLLQLTNSKYAIVTCCFQILGFGSDMQKCTNVLSNIYNKFTKICIKLMINNNG